VMLRLSSAKAHSLFQIFEIRQCECTVVNSKHEIEQLGGTVGVDQCVKCVAIALELNTG
jgi:hypothetical protein